MKRGLRYVLLFASLSLFAHAETGHGAVRALDDPSNHAAARDRLQRMVAAEPQNAEAHYLLGIAYENLGRADDAIRQLELATRLQPANSDYMLELGGAYGLAAQKAGVLSKYGWAKKCQAALEKAVELDPNNLSARNGLFSYYREAPAFMGGGSAKAHAQAEEIRKRNPVAGAVVLGQLYLDDRKTDEAFALYETTLKSAPDNYGLLYGIGRTAAQTGQHLDRGEQCLRRCLELKPGPDDPPLAAVRWRLGNIAEKRGDRSSARSAYEAALKLDPNFQPAARSLAALGP